MDIRMKWFYRLAFLLLFFIVIYVFFKLKHVWAPFLEVFTALLIPFAVGGFITYLLHPIIENLHNRGVHRGIAVFIIYTLFFGGVGFGLYRGIPAFIHQLHDLAENAPMFTAHYQELVDGIQDETSRLPPAIKERIDESIIAVEAYLEGILSTLLSILKGFLNSIVTIAIIPFIAFYMLKDFNLMKRAAWYLTPSRWRENGKMFLRDVDKSLGSYIRGQLLVCLVVGVLSTLFFFLAGMPYSLLLGFIVGITNVIPYFGPIIGAVPAVIIAATISMKMVIICLIIVFSLQFLEGNILSPIIVGKSLHMHPLLIMFALIGGGEVGGLFGLVLAVPIVVVIRTAILHAREYMIRVKSRPAHE
ncbi:Predicted PurR-regulated permease PerM [Mesobacillus persicus]|uniref:Predicted PurR-regulated permease PerM n=1 Tax=Mesobacillus persicus TaxID=930146 RepID=A0A1H7XC66_9BACI|nr:AI-2E family transporter [Mesobacillus persicus]SEM31416.1 Predicted PurR-regulated permease PerM [Mesobacillus persicus]